jgi:cytochrome c oxidase cbb3-type subunit 3
LADDATRDGDLSPLGIDTRVSGVIFLAMLGLLLGGFVTFKLLSKPAPPPPPEVARDPLLSHGRVIFLARCATCHGNEGRGDGPIAGQLLGPPVGNLTDNEWKHGDRPEEVLRVIAQGVPNTRMDGWSRVLDPPDLKAVTAFVYYLAKRPVPQAIREP